MVWDIQYAQQDKKSMKSIKNLRGKLFFWYLTSLISVTAFFYLAVHFYSLPNSNILFCILLLILALEGFFIIRKMTNELTTLSSKIKSITSKNLDETITGITSDDEIGELATSFNQLLDRLHKAFERERQFIADVAHELKTPLATLQGAIEVAKTKKRSTPQYEQVLDELLIDAKRLSGTLTTILDLAWSKSDTYESVQDMTDISVVMHELTEVAQKLAYGKNITIRAHIKDHLDIRGKKDKIFRALLNLIDNAVKFNKGGGSITLTLKDVDKQVVIMVKDTGSGIAQGEIAHIFDRYYRGSKTDKTVGSGLGLSIAHAIIISYGGTITAQSSVDHGTTFTVIFPLEHFS